MHAAPGVRTMHSLCYMPTAPYCPLRCMLTSVCFACCRALLLPKGASETQVPRFWLRVLKSADAAALAISPRDAAVLAALADVRFSLDGTAGASELQGKCECCSRSQLANRHSWVSCWGMLAKMPQLSQA